MPVDRGVEELGVVLERPVRVKPDLAPRSYVQKLTSTMKTSGAIRKKPSQSAPGSAQRGGRPTASCARRARPRLAPSALASGRCSRSPRPRSISAARLRRRGRSRVRARRSWTSSSFHVIRDLLALPTARAPGSARPGPWRASRSPPTSRCSFTRSPRNSTKIDLAARRSSASVAAGIVVVDLDRARRAPRRRPRRRRRARPRSPCTLALTPARPSTTSRSPSRARHRPRMMLLSPMKRATSSVSGRVAIVSGVRDLLDPRRRS